jgi:hypothetical protein
MTTFPLKARLDDREVFVVDVALRTGKDQDAPFREGVDEPFSLGE